MTWRRSYFGALLLLHGSVVRALVWLTVFSLLFFSFFFTCILIFILELFSSDAYIYQLKAFNDTLQKLSSPFKILRCIAYMEIMVFSTAPLMLRYTVFHYVNVFIVQTKWFYSECFISWLWTIRVLYDCFRPDMTRNFKFIYMR